MAFQTWKLLHLLMWIPCGLERRWGNIYDFVALHFSQAWEAPGIKHMIGLLLCHWEHPRITLCVMEMMLGLLLCAMKNMLGLLLVQ